MPAKTQAKHNKECNNQHSKQLRAMRFAEYIRKDNSNCVKHCRNQDRDQNVVNPEILKFSHIMMFLKFLGKAYHI